MAQEHKPKAQAKPKQEAKKPIPGWTWLVAGVAIGLFAAFLAYLVISNPDAAHPDTQTAHPSKPAKPKKAETKKEPEPAPAEPRFSFYTDLPKIKIEIPAEEIKSLSGDSKDKAAPPPSKPSHESRSESAPSTTTRIEETPKARAGAYILQVGSFKSYNEADQLKAKLAFMGVEASIQPVSITSRDRWYRVRVGPYANQNQANGVKEKLKQKSISAIVLKLSE
jgi:cell division protein FtsN